MEKLSSSEKEELRAILTSNLFRKVADDVCRELYNRTKGAETMERAALNMKFVEGFCAAFSSLNQAAALPPENRTILPRTLKRS